MKHRYEVGDRVIFRKGPKKEFKVTEVRRSNGPWDFIAIDDNSWPGPFPSTALEPLNSKVDAGRQNG